MPEQEAVKGKAALEKLVDSELALGLMHPANTEPAFMIAVDGEGIIVIGPADRCMLSAYVRPGEPLRIIRWTSAPDRMGVIFSDKSAYVLYHNKEGMPQLAYERVSNKHYTPHVTREDVFFRNALFRHQSTND